MGSGLESKKKKTKKEEEKEKETVRDGQFLRSHQQWYWVSLISRLSS